MSILASPITEAVTPAPAITEVEAEEMGKRFPYGKCRKCNSAIAIPGLDYYQCSNPECPGHKWLISTSPISDYTTQNTQQATKRRRKKS